MTERVRVAAAVAVLLLGCSGDATSGAGRRAGESAAASREPRSAAMPHEACVSGTNISTLDVNGDGQVDIRTEMADGRPRCRETDANFDGRVDIYRWFEPSSGQVTRVEEDYDFDGRVDVVATFEGGVVARDVMDTNFDGLTDTWRNYRGGRVIELRRDADGDGRVDTWERFDDTGRVIYSATDANRDGTPDDDDAGTPAPVTDGGAAAVAAPAAPAPAAPATGTQKGARR
ncbi:MAG: hypothetical protein Q8S73_30635 [Deltaproteobacteria bacterium]|nr:hypothetical protein [Myxococcales bacterium]MDP3218499.1 hypothetical protein [Deltaproteobacteria bacterium]